MAQTQWPREGIPRAAKTAKISREYPLPLTFQWFQSLNCSHLGFSLPLSTGMERLLTEQLAGEQAGRREEVKNHWDDGEDGDGWMDASVHRHGAAGRGASTQEGRGGCIDIGSQSLRQWWWLWWCTSEKNVTLWCYKETQWWVFPCFQSQTSPRWSLQVWGCQGDGLAGDRRNLWWTFQNQK